MTDLLRLNDLQSGMAAGGADSDWGGFLVRTLLEGADGYCVHETLRNYSAETAQLLDRIREIGGAADPDRFTATDAMHIDFHHRNVLQARGRVAAVIDWDCARNGDRVFDLVTLVMGATVADCTDGLLDELWARITRLRAPDVVLAYVAHMSLRLVDWTIRHHPDDVQTWLTSCTSAMDALD